MTVSLARNIAVSIPHHTPEEWAAIDKASLEWEQQEREKETQARLSRANIPSEYKNASLEEVEFDEIKSWAANPTVGIVLYGEPGRGKTHAACALLRAFAVNRTVLFSSLRDLMRKVKATYDNYDSEADVISRYSKVGLLVIDDFGKEKLTDWGAEKAFSVLDERICEGRPTVITTNYAWSDMLARTFGVGDPETLNSMASRLFKFERVNVIGEDRRQLS